ncbi:MAG: DUF1439 domain-containing protein [Polaromonas sp.]
MQRRAVLGLAAGLALGLSACSASSGARQPGFTVSPGQLQQALARRFPRRYPLGGGLIEINVQTPQLRLLPEQNRLGTELMLDAGGPALGRSYDGTLDMDFALRYEASDRSIRAHGLHVNSLHLDDLPPNASQRLNAYAPALAERLLGEVVLHQLSAQELALPETMGLEPRITVTPKGLLISFVNKPIAPQ